MRDAWYKFFLSSQAAADLERLHLGEEREKVQKNYCMAKIKKTAAIALVGTALAVFLAARASAERKIDPVVIREDVAEEIQELEVQAAVGNARESFQIQVYPRQLEQAEAEELCRKFRGELPTLIAGENDSLREVRTSLCLEECFEGYPFEITWKSSNTDVISSSGEVNPTDEEWEVTLTADIEYGETVWEEQMEARVLPALLTEEERRRKELEELLIGAESGSRTDRQWSLPAVWREEQIAWSRVVDDYSRILWIGSLIVAAAVYFFTDRDLHSEVEKRKEKMKLDYPDIVHKLALYLGAGLTLRGSFQRIAAEYEQGKRRGEPETAIYEEMLYACRELQTGVSEAAAYEHFGKRTGLQEYIRLTTLLTQNLKKGNSALLQRLYEEADRASAERIRNSRRLGEEASTKLLIPMVMMLGVVMVMVMLPALTSMGM